MKILLVAVALLVAIEGWTEAKPGWAAYPGFQNTRGNFNGRGPPWAQPQSMENQNNRFTINSDVEWICQNPRTNDIMIIAPDDTRNTPQPPQQNPDRRPWQWHNVPPGHQHHPHGNHWTHDHAHNQPIIIIQETPNTDDKTQTPLPFPTTTEIPNNNDKQTQPPYNGGEGSIDIRVGAE